MEDTFININLEEVDDGFEPLPDGPCKITVVSIEQKQKAGSDYPYLAAVLSPRAEEFKNRKLFNNFTLNPRGLFNLKDFVKKAGVRFDSKGFDYKDLIGKDVTITLGIEPAFNDPERKVNVVKMPYHAG